MEQPQMLLQHQQYLEILQAAKSQAHSDIHRITPLTQVAIHQIPEL